MEHDWSEGVYNRADWPRVNLWITWYDRKGCRRREPAKLRRDLTGKGKKERARIAKDLNDKAAHLRERHLAGKRGFIAELAPGKKTPLLSDLLPAWSERRVVRRHASEPSLVKRIVNSELGYLRVTDVSRDDIEGAVVAWTRDGLSANYVNCLVHLISNFYNDQGPAHGVAANPAQLTAQFRRKWITKRKPDKMGIPYLKTAADIARCYKALPTFRDMVMFAIGVFAGLRPGELVALRRDDIDLERRRIQVARQKLRACQETGPTKGRYIRHVLINDDLLPILQDWLSSDNPGWAAGSAYLFPVMHRRADGYTMLDIARFSRLARAHFKGLTWYQATRHTFASQWVIAGKHRGQLQVAMGHRSSEMTDRYTHLDPSYYSADSFAPLCGDLLQPEGVTSLTRHKAGTKRSQARSA
jgi:integrase